MDNKKWLVVESHDERYDFNLQITNFFGTVEQFEEKIKNFYDIEHDKEVENGKIVYRKRNTASIKHVLNSAELEGAEDVFQVVYFAMTMLIPLDEIAKDDFYIYDEITHKNIKFGFIDFKEDVY